MFNKANTSNTTNTSSDCGYLDIDHEYPAYFDTYLNVISGTIIVISVIANTLVIRGIYLTRCRPIGYYLIFNLALAELLGSLLEPFEMHYQTRPWYWVFGKTMCHISSPGRLCCSIVVSLSFVIFSLIGCLSLRKPNQQKVKRFVLISILLSWAFGITIVAPLVNIAVVISYRVCRENNTATAIKEMCVIISTDPGFGIYLHSTPIVFQVVIPFIVIVISYTTMLVMVKKFKNRSRVNSDFNRLTTSHSDVGQNTQQEQSDQAMDYPRQDTISQAETPNHRDENVSTIKELEKKLIRLIYWMVIIFVVCYIPDNLTFIIWRYGSLNFIDKKMLFRRHTSVFMIIPKLLHPICFGWTAGIIQRNFQR